MQDRKSQNEIFKIYDHQAQQGNYHDAPHTSLRHPHVSLIADTLLLLIIPAILAELAGDYWNIRFTNLTPCSVYHQARGRVFLPNNT